MKTSHKGFTNILIIVLAVVVIAGYIAWNRNLLPEKLGSRNTEVNTVETNSSMPEGMESYSNSVFSTIYPKGWTTEEEGISSHGCSARVYFTQNSVPKQVLINEDTDYLHYLKNTGSVISIGGGIGELKMSYEQLKKSLSDTEKDGRKIKQTFFQEEVKETGHTLDTESSAPSLTYYFEFPQYNKKGISKSLVLNGKYPQMVTITYISPEAEYSTEFFNVLAASVKNTLTSNQCDPFENSSVQKDKAL